MGPHIAHRQGVAEAEIAPGNCNFAGQTIQVVDSDIDTAVRLLRHPHGLWAAGHLYGGEAGLIDREEFVVREGRLGEVIELGEVSTEIHWRVRHGPNRNRTLLLNVRKAIERAIADVERVHVIPSQGGAGLILPAHIVVLAQHDARPVGQGGTAAFALYIVVNAARVGPLLPHRSIVLRELPGDRKPDGATRFGNGGRPGLNGGPGIDGESVYVRARRDRVKVDEIETPGGAQRNDPVNLLL